MAITRAQQFRQMLENGGMLVKPGRGKRPGYREDKAEGRQYASDTATSRSVREAIDRQRDRGETPAQDFRDDAKQAAQRLNTLQRPARTLTSFPTDEGPDFGPRFGIPKTTAQKKALQNYLNQVDLAMYSKDPLVIGDEDDADSIDDLLTSGTDATKLLEDDKRQELVESYVNQPINLPEGPSAISFVTNAFKNQLQKNAANLRQGIVDLSDRFSKERTINYPKFMTKDGKQMSFDANLRTKSNLLSNLLDTEKTKLGLKGDPQTGRVDFYDLPTSSQKEIGKKVLDARMQGLTDAAGNLKAGVRIEQIPFRKADGTIEMRSQIIDNRDDRGGSDPVTITSNPELLKLQKQNKDLENQLAQQEDRNRLFRLLADGGMPEDAPVGGIMDAESGRQMYFLGKLVKKATRAVKKIVKSPIGIAGLGFLAMQNPAISGFIKKKAMPFLFKEGTIGSGLTGGGMLALGGALTAAPLLFGKQEEDDTIDPALLGPRIDIARLLERPYEASLGMGFRRTAADGGRIGYSEGDLSRDKVYQKWVERYEKNPESPLVTMHENFDKYKTFYESSKNKKADGGIMRIGYQEGSKEPVAKKTMPLLDMGGQEMDLRDNGGFVPIGRMEKADDVPARLSKNEFVFTADAVRNAGDGDIDKGAEVMYNMMKNLEDGGNVSEESQGLEGARNMFQTAQRLEEVL